MGSLRSPEAVVRELEAKVKEFPNHRAATIGRRIFSRQRPQGAEKLPGVWWHGLEEMYGDEREARHRAGYKRKPVGRI